MSKFAQTSSGLFVPSNYVGSRTYEGARQTRHRKWMPTIAKDTNKTITPWVRTTLLSHGRNMYANSGLVGGAIDDVGRYMIGDDGVQPEPLTDDPAYNAEVKERWRNWCLIADYRRKLHLNKIAQLSSTSPDVDGDFFINLTETGGGNERGGMAQIQCIRGHRIGDAVGSAACDTNDGVLEDRTGITVSYRLIDGENRDQFTDLPARSVVQVMDAIFSDQPRGLSAIARGINQIFDAREATQFELEALKNNSARSLVIKTPTGEVPDDVLDDELNAGNGIDDLTLEEIQSGEILRLGPGEEIQDVSNTRPGNNFVPYMEFNFRDFACGYGVPLEVIWKSDLGGPSQRFFLSKFQRRINARLALVTIPIFYRRIYIYWLAKEIKRKALPFRPDWYKVAFQPTSPKITIDIGREAQQDREDILLGTRTLSEDAGERGKDWREIRNQSEKETEDLIDRAQRLAEKKKISFEVALSLLSRRTPNGNLPQSEPAPVPANRPV
ncbi:MAG: hypothetical protein JWL59_1345 [Chthoniobacteraceae bacterium]|nr:hypothetical protein [Chthoniobacteraceae bacterium]